jgi:YjbE family integral membrane protein
MNDIWVLVLQGLQIVWINILLSGDNAVVIALACRGLEPRQRRWAITAGSLVAVVLRIVFTIFIVELLKLPYVKLFSGVLLLWIAFELLRSNDHQKDVAAASSIWGAVRTIALADAIMSLDNVVAVAAAANNDLGLIVFGIAISVPLIIFGSTLMLRLLNRFPILVVAGAALLGWVAGEILVSDPALTRWLGVLPEHIGLYAAGGGAAFILVVAGILRLTRGHPNVQATSK